jgi:putative addiction module component (TIGR02574 family)
MPASLQSLKSDALHLAPEERLQLASVLLASVEPIASDASETAWDAEIRRRIAEFDAGRLVTVPGKNVFGALDRKLAR